MSQIKKVDNLIRTYRELAQIPALVGGYITKKNNVISTWSQRNLEKGKSSKYVKFHTAYGNGTFQDFFPVDVSDEILSVVSPTEKFKATIRDVENGKGNSQFLEIWESNNLVRSIDLTKLDIHGKVYSDGEFSSFQWSEDEKMLLYVAEKKPTKRNPINERPKSDTPEEKLWKSEEYQQDWGEQLVTKISSILVIYKFDDDAFFLPTGIPENICVAQPIWSPKSEEIVGIAYDVTPRKLGLIYCTNRPSTIFKLDLKGNYSEFPLKNKSVKSPRFTPDGKSLVWLQRAAGGPHMSSMTLVQAVFPFSENFKESIKVDLVKNESEISNGSKFYGLYTTKLPNRCWLTDGKLVLSTNQKNTINSYVIDIENKSVLKLEYDDASLVVLDVSDNKILLNSRNFLAQDNLFMAIATSNNYEFQQVTTTKPLRNSKDYSYTYLDLKHDNHDEINSFSAIYVGPKNKKDIPLIVWPHGGPHSAFANNLALEISYFLTLGYAIVMVNYRGSIGAGEATVQYLPGRVGKADVEDCVLATKTVLKDYAVDKDRISLIGGSHGGFLVTHLSGQYPDLYKAVVARNPVIDVASMSIVSDIPDWCYVEAGYDYTQVGEIDEQILLAMRRCSPIVHAHKVKAPTLLQVGTKDLRVPPSQAIDYFHRLKANNIVAKMNVYDDNHPLGAVPNEMDNIVSTALWLEEHVK